LVSTPNSSLLTATFVVPITCPAGHSGCTGFSNPLLFGDVFWQNRSFYAGITGAGTGTANQQNTVGLFEAFTNTPAPTQSNGQTAGVTGSCPAFNSGSYWDIGVRGDTSRSPNSGSGFSLHPVYSFLTSTGGYGGANNSGSDPTVITQYCNGSRIPPECTLADGCVGGGGFAAPPGIADAVVPNPVFSFTPAATVDEGNNWLNVTWGPLSLTNPAITGGAYNNYGGGPPLGNYSLQGTSTAIGYIPCGNGSSVANGCRVAATAGLPAFTLPLTDFFGNSRPDAGAAPSLVDVGAVEVPGH
jgi:hypothetical protein